MLDLKQYDRKAITNKSLFLTLFPVLLFLRGHLDPTWCWKHFQYTPALTDTLCCSWRSLAIYIITLPKANLYLLFPPRFCFFLLNLQISIHTHVYRDPHSYSPHIHTHTPKQNLDFVPPRSCCAFDFKRNVKVQANFEISQTTAKLNKNKLYSHTTFSRSTLSALSVLHHPRAYLDSYPYAWYKPLCLPFSL